MNNPRKAHIEKTWKSFSYSVIGIALPFILSLLPILVLKNYSQIFSFFDEGQFLIFGAGLFTSSHFLYSENQNSIKKECDKFLSNFCLWAMIICSAFYATIYCFKLIEIQIPLDLWFIRIVSLILYLIAIYAIFRSIYLDFLKSFPEIDVRAESKKGVDSIIEQLKKS